MASQMMKVLQVYKDFQPIGGGGVARYIHGLSTVLAADLGHDVRVAVLPSGGVVPVEGAPYEALAVPPSQLVDHVRWADVVHLHGARNRYAHRAAQHAIALDKPYLFTPHCYYDHGSATRRVLKFIWDRTAERRLVAHAAYLILLDEGLVKDAELRSLPVDRAVVMPTPVLWRELSANARNPTSLSGKPSILSISRVDPIKRLDDVIRAIASVPELADAHLHIVGKGPDGRRLQSIADRLGVSERVRLYGYQPDEEAMRMLAGADVFVLASEREGMPATLLEALLVGRPVVASNIEGNAYVLRPWGLAKNLVPLGDHIALGKKLAAVAASGSIEDDLRQRIHAKHTWEGAAVEIARLYVAAANERSGKRH